MIGIRAKLILYIVTPVVLVFAGLGFLGVRELEEMMMQQMRLRGRAMVAALARGCQSPLSNHEIWKLDNIVDRFTRKNARELGVVYVYIVDYEGFIRADTEERYLHRITDPFVLEVAKRENRRSRFTKMDGEGQILELVSPIGSRIRWGAVVAGFSMRSLHQQIRTRQRHLVIVVIALALLVTGVLYFALSRSVIEPIQDLSRAAEQVGRGSLEARTRVVAQDEIGQLANSFNRMTEQLQKYTMRLEEAVAERTRQLQELNSQLERLAITDGLTALFNHRYFKENLREEVDRCKRTGDVFSLLIFDIDSFKQFNDTNGHLQGDKLLVGVADILRRAVRKTDMVARYGGEEFVVLAVDTPREGAVQLANKIREAVASYPFHYREQQPGGRVTISGGVAMFPEDASDVDGLIVAADRALYRAKGAGKNRVCSTRDEEPKA